MSNDDKKKNISLLSVIFLFLCIFTSVNIADAQPDTRGTDFWVCFPQNAKNEFNAGLAFKLYITGDYATSGTILMQGKSAIHFSIKAGEIISIDIDTTLQVFGSDQIQNLGIHVHSDQPVAVFGLSNRKASTDSYVAFPTNVLGTAYRAMCYNALAGNENTFTSQLTIVAIDDHTIVSITPTANTKGGKHAGEPFNVTLNRGEVYQMQGTRSGDGNSDLTGTLVTSTNPIAFFTGHICAQVPQYVNFCDQLLEEEAPINTWGRQFFVGKLQGKDWYVTRVVASENDTKIFENEKYIKSLNAGEFLEAQHEQNNTLLTSDKPILVGEYATSADADSVKIGDPFLMLITPTEQFLSSYRFVTPVGEGAIQYGTVNERLGMDSMKNPSSKFTYSKEYLDNVKKEAASGTGWHHYINVIAPFKSVNSLRLDGNGISSDLFHSIGITQYSIAQIEIAYGSHTITCDKPFGLYSYGFGVGGNNYDSYGNNAGQKVGPIQFAADTSKPTLEIVQADTSPEIILIARDDRINDLGLATIQVTDSANVTNPISYPVFDIGAPEFRFSIKRTSLTNCFYVKLKDFAKNESFYALCPASPNSSGAANENFTYNITPILLQQQDPHEVYPIEIYPSPAKYGQPVNINFTNLNPEIIQVQVLDEGGNIVEELQKKILTASGKHSLVYHSEKYSSGNFFLRFTAYAQNEQVLYRQDEHFVVSH